MVKTEDLSHNVGYTVEPRLSGLVETGRNSPDNLGS